MFPSHDRGGSGSGSGGGSGLIDLAPEDERILAGAGFSASDIKDVQRLVAELGITETINRIQSTRGTAAANAVRKVYNVTEYKTRADAEAKVNELGVSTVLETVYDTSELKALADEAGSSAWWRPKSRDINAFYNTDAAKQKAIDLYVQKFKQDGIYAE